MRSWIRGQWQHWPLLVIIVLTLVAYSNTFSVPFQFDDSSHLDWAKQVAVSPVESWYSKAIASYPNRVVPMLTFIIQYALIAESSLTFLHFGNIFIHLINIVLAYALTYVLLELLAKPALSRRQQIIISASVAGLFALHPVQTQAITYLIQRMTAVSATFFLSSSLLFALSIRLSIQKKKRAGIILLIFSTLMGILSFYSKQNSLVLPFVLGSLLWLLREKISKTDRLICAVAVGFVLAWASWLVLSVRMNPEISVAPASSASLFSEKLTPMSYVLTQFSLVPRYVSVLILPIRQSIDHAPQTFSTLESPVLIGSMVWLAMVGLAFWFNRRQPVLSFGIGWYLITMLVEGSILPISDPFVEHRLYLPFFGLALVAVYAFFHLLKRYNSTWMLVWVIATIMSLLTIITYNRNAVWLTPISLWENATLNSSTNPRAFYNLGVSFVVMGEKEKALRAFLQAVNLNSNYHFANNNLGALYYGVGDYRSALQHFLKAVEAKPSEELYLENLEKAVLALDSDEVATSSPELVLEMFR